MSGTTSNKRMEAQEGMNEEEYMGNQECYPSLTYYEQGNQENVDIQVMDNHC